MGAVVQFSNSFSFKYVCLNYKDAFCLYNFIKIISSNLMIVLVLGWNS